MALAKLEVETRRVGPNFVGSVVPQIPYLQIRCELFSVVDLSMSLVSMTLPRLSIGPEVRPS
jgi:hypothetical protein